MKTKKIKLVIFCYVIGYILLFISFFWLLLIFEEIYLLLLLVFSLVLCGLMIIGYSHIKKMMVWNWECYLREKIQKKDWPLYMEFPIKEYIQQWIGEYEKIVYVVSPYILFITDGIWSSIENNPSKYMDVILKRLFIPVIGVNGGISLFELYYLESVYVEKADFKVDTCDELEQTRAFLQYMPVQDLTVYVHPPIHLSTTSLYYLMIRDENVGDFNEVCLSLMKSNCEIIAPMDVIDYLISDTQGSVSVVFPQRFLAYLIKMEVENRFNLKSDPEKRKKVFDWYMSQSVQEFDFYSYWPNFTPEELEYVLANFEGDDVRDEIFIAQQDWKHVSTDRLKVMYKPFINNWRTQCPDALLLEVLNRF